MKKADPNCRECKGKGYVNDIYGNFHDTCHCIESQITTTEELRKPKRKRHILKRKKRI